MKVLFVCKGNMVRSPLAAALYNTLTGTNDACSAGTYPGALDEPEGRTLREAFTSPVWLNFLESKGIFLDAHKTIRLTPEMLADTDVVVSMAEEPFRPEFLLQDPRVIWWEVENPDITSEEVAQRVFEKVEQLVVSFVKDLCTS